jgi:hypothetical protein
MERFTVEDKNRVGAVLQYHRLAMSARTDEALLVNLWVAIECLVRIPGKSIIANVCDFVAPTVVTHHINGVLRNLAIDLRTLWRHDDGDGLRQAAGKRGNESNIPLESLLSWLLQDDEGTEIKELYRLCTKNPLLIHRLYRVQENYLRTHKVFKKALELHRRNIEWQIRRIYRGRNLLMHWGRTPSSIRDLIQHLHSYLVLSLNNLFNDLRYHPEWGVIEALEHRQFLYEYCVGDDAATTMTTRTLLQPGKVFSRDFGENCDAAWPTGDDTTKREVKE